MLKASPQPAYVIIFSRHSEYLGIEPWVAALQPLLYHLAIFRQPSLQQPSPLCLQQPLKTPTRVVTHVLCSASVFRLVIRIANHVTNVSLCTYRIHGRSSSPSIHVSGEVVVYDSPSGRVHLFAIYKSAGNSYVSLFPFSILSQVRRTKRTNFNFFLKIYHVTFCNSPMYTFSPSCALPVSSSIRPHICSA